MRDRTDIAAAIESFGPAVMRVCAVYLHEKADREDIFQETFLRFAQRNEVFSDAEHQRAWLIRVASNLCKDLLKRASSKNESLDALSEDTNLEIIDETAADASVTLENQDVTKALAKLDDKYRIVLYLRYYEEYTVAQIAQVLGCPDNTVYTLLARGKKQLKGVLEHDSAAAQQARVHA